MNKEEKDAEVAGGDGAYYSMESNPVVGRSSVWSGSSRVSTLVRADHSAPVNSMSVAVNDHRTMLMDCTKGGTSLASFARSQGHVRMLRYLETSSRTATAAEAGIRRLTGIFWLGSSQ